MSLLDTSLLATREVGGSLSPTNPEAASAETTSKTIEAETIQWILPSAPLAQCISSSSQGAPHASSSVPARGSLCWSPASDAVSWCGRRAARSADGQVQVDAQEGMWVMRIGGEKVEGEGEGEKEGEGTIGVGERKSMAGRAWLVCEHALLSLWSHS